jgi:hypothetical protein
MLDSYNLPAKIIKFLKRNFGRRIKLLVGGLKVKRFLWKVFSSILIIKTKIKLKIVIR